VTSSPPLTHATILRIRPGALFKRIQQEAVILVLAENRFLAVTDVAARTLELVDGETPLGDILSSLFEEYDVSRERLEADVYAFLGQVIAASVVEVAEWNGFDSKTSTRSGRS
jgi:pyrroloquinoline quinone biosynthesis protein D